MKEEHALPPVVHLAFKEGDLIIKEGDYGVSIYKILSGKVGIYIQSDETEIMLATLGKSEIFGEMAFLNAGIEPRSASARALEPTRLEAWHPERLAQEYADMAPIIKYVTNQILMRLGRMNKLIGKYGVRKRKAPPPAESAATQREYYRKMVAIPCEYRPLNIQKEIWLKGKIKNISMKGIGLDVSTKNEVNFSHDPGNVFRLRASLSNQRELEMDGRVVSVRKGDTPGRTYMGLAVVNISEDARKTLGFFMMP